MRLFLAAAILLAALPAMAQDAAVDREFDGRLEEMVYSSGGQVAALTDEQKARFVTCVQDGLDDVADSEKQALLALSGDDATRFLDDLIERTGLSSSLFTCIGG